MIKRDLGTAGEAVKSRKIEQIIFAAGLLLLTVWGVGRLDGVLASRSAIAEFQTRKAAAAGENLSSGSDPASDSTVDVSLWSNKRIEAYKQSLLVKTDAPLAILRAPKINLVAPVFENTDDLTLNRGLGRIRGTAQIGEIGNVGIAGHRDGFFRGLKDIGPGDVIELSLPGRTDRYTVSQIQIVKPEDTSVLKATTTPTLTLVTCFPFYYFGSAPQRYIVTASITTSGQQK